MKHKWIILMVGLSAASGTILFKQWQRMHAHSQRGGLPVMTHQVQGQSYQETLHTIGFLKANAQADLKAEIAGTITEVMAFEGKVMQKGASLLFVDSREIKQSVDKAAGALELSKLTFERNKELASTHTISKQTLNESQANLKQAQALYNQTVIQLDKTAIKVPFDGVIGLRHTNVGDYLHVGDLITTVSAVDPMAVEFSVAQKYLSKMKPDLAIRLTTEAWPGRVYDGIVTAIDPQLDPMTGMIVAKAIINNEDHSLRPGLFASIDVLFENESNAILIPEEAILPSATKMTVMKVEHGRVKMTDVLLSARANGLVKIEKGLAIGDNVIVAGQMKVREGMPVSAIPVPLAVQAPVRGDKEAMPQSPSAS